ncbi:uncharacterized protein [Aristolochia californica]|uniref:uncharacterized protein n=1 Tax=Aristolochia californica TaxID=171875 RepID=UPI0035D5ED54
MAEWRSKNLYYNCDEQYWVGHQCKQFFWLKVADSDDLEVPKDIIEEEPPEISLHAITGQKSPNTMQVRAHVINRELVRLVDSGSTHNFLSLTAAQHLQLQIHPRSTATVSVAKGEKVPSYGISKAVTISIASTSFNAEFFVIPLAGFDMVLGIKWLQTLGPILLDFSFLTMSFYLAGSRLLLQGCQVDRAHRIHTLQTLEQPTSTIVDLVEFSDLFQEPSGLPTLRHCDHMICLKPGSKVVVVRPYHYPHLQKDEIEHQCHDLLQ